MMSRLRDPVARLLAAPEVRLAIQGAIAISAALLVAETLDLHRPYWVVLTAYLLVAGSYGESTLKAIARVAGTVAGIIAGQTIYLLLNGWSDALLILTALTVFGGVLFMRALSDLWSLVLHTAALTLMFHVNGMPAVIFYERAANTLIGAVIVVLATRLVLPIRTEARVSELLADFLMGAADHVRASAAILSPTPAPRPSEQFEEGRLLRNRMTDLAQAVEALDPASALKAFGRIGLSERRDKSTEARLLVSRLANLRATALRMARSGTPFARASTHDLLLAYADRLTALANQAPLPHAHDEDIDDFETDLLTEGYEVAVNDPRVNTSLHLALRTAALVRDGLASARALSQRIARSSGAPAPASFRTAGAGAE